MLVIVLLQSCLSQTRTQAEHRSFNPLHVCKKLINTFKNYLKTPIHESGQDGVSGAKRLGQTSPEGHAV